MSGWIGVDLDGTLAQYGGWNGGVIGKPIPLMADRVKKWIAEGKEVRIFTARACRRDEEEREFHVNQITAWCKEHFGVALTVTNEKDYAMVELWDDRAIQVEMNTGRRVARRMNKCGYRYPG